MLAQPPLTELLPRTRGKLIPHAPLADTTWFRVGGTAEVLFKPQDADDLGHFLANCPPEVPLTVMGAASNVLVRDGGIAGVVIRLGPSFATIKVEGLNLQVGASAVDLNVARRAQSEGLGGLEFLSGIPGTIGGGLRMNAGAYGREFKDIVVDVHALDRQGHPYVFSQQNMGFSYRHCQLSENYFFIATTLKAQRDDPEAIRERMVTIQQSRSHSQPIREKTGGSTFANPTQDPAGRKAWQLIDAAGCRGLQKGLAKVSEHHCNFLINTGNATASDIETLGEEVRKRVYDKFGITLEWEIRRLGVPKQESQDK